MKNFTIFCESRNSFYADTTKNDVTIWRNKIENAKTFKTKIEAEKLVLEFKNSAMGDTKYLVVE